VTLTQLPSRAPPPAPLAPQSPNNLSSPSNIRQSTRYSSTPFSPPPPPNNASASARISITQQPSAAAPQTVKFGSITATTMASSSLPQDLPVNPNPDTSIGTIVRQSSLDRAVADSTDRGEEVKRQQTIERQMLEKDLQEKMKIQQEGRKREALARERAMSRQRVEAARALESKNPMTLAGSHSPPPRHEMIPTPQNYFV
jgi:hypothetical protein